MKLKQLLSAAGAALILASPSTTFALKSNININDMVTAAKSIGTINNIEYYDYNGNYKIDIGDLCVMAKYLTEGISESSGAVGTLNFYREQQGLPALANNHSLQLLADQRAQEQADGNWITHQEYKTSVQECTLFNTYSKFEEDALKIAIREFYTYTYSKEMILNPKANYAAVGIAQAGDGTWIITLMTQEK